ncbi:MAG: P1 family peptidase [Acidimicrobiia bacterium]
MSANRTLTAVAGIKVGHWTDPVAMTGCTVVDLPEPNVAAVETRGAAPGSRETALLEPGMLVEQVQAIVLCGGSAFGLAAADGVMSELERVGRGHPTQAGPVPIVPAAVVYDLAEGDAAVRPRPEHGVAAFRDASPAPVASGRVGAGAGCTVAKWRGLRLPGGVGSWAVEGDGFTVGALVVLNAVGDVFSLEGRSLTGGPAVPGVPRRSPAAGENTTLVVVATDARIGRADLTRLAVRSHDALAVCIRPVHTRFDGDTCFAVSCGSGDAGVDEVAEAAFEAVGRAVEAAVGATGVSFG